MAAALAVLGSLPAPAWSGPVVGAPFDDTPWIGKIFGSIIGIIVLLGIVAWSLFAVADLAQRDDIGAAKKLLWVAAFLLSAGIVLVVYGAVRFSRTDGHPGW